ncbi:aldo/keto reductase [Lentinula aciculospora]|uniref:Aldo/keto reductase n=1 Tax=Lentinula aciculospora TaxID=153920 RepID=A0A9W9DM65_9AGAR|nr:aldo/keto reductase [Lentinula aciculospora]
MFASKYFYAPSILVSTHFIDGLQTRTKAFLNSGEFYAMDLSTGNLKLLSIFYAKYPEYADKTFLSVKGSVRHGGPDGSYVPSSSQIFDLLLIMLGPHKKRDLFEPARIDHKTPLETIMNNLVILLKEGKFLHIGLSNCNSNTLRKANVEPRQIYPITAAKIEVSPWSYDNNQKAVISTVRELNITVVAYSPLGRGYLTGQIKSTSDLPEGDVRLRLTRVKEEYIKANWAIVEDLKVIAEKKGIMPAQLSIAWVASLGPHMLPLPGSLNSSCTLENLKAGEIELTPEESKAIEEVITANPVVGDRYFGSDEQAHLWG